MASSPQNDNRSYRYSHASTESRAEFDSIIEMVEPNSRVIDLGCGSGVLLRRLIEERKASGKGIELSPSGVQVARSWGLDVVEGRIDERLSIDDDQFDYAICNVTLQMVLYPEVLLREMKRIARYQIVSFPNFGFYKNRFDLLLNGRMPRPMLFDYSWYATGHIHQLSIADFQQIVNDVGGIRFLRQHFDKTGNSLKDALTRKYPNLFAVRPIFLLEKTK